MHIRSFLVAGLIWTGFQFSSLNSHPPSSILPLIILPHHTQLSPFTMASEASAANGSSSKSLAAMLEAKHDEAHRPTVEEVIDEEDITHPPPSSLVSNKPAAPTPIPVSETSTPAESAISSPAPKAAQKKAPAFDVQSEELFPALGSGPKPAVSAAATWGAKRPSAAAAVVANGMAPQPMDGPRVMTLPGKHMEQLRLAPSQMLPRGQLKKPLRDILRDISRRSKANVDMRGGPGGSIVFEGKGSVDAVRQALREVAQQVGSKVSARNTMQCAAGLILSKAIRPRSHSHIRTSPHHWSPGCGGSGYSDSHWCPCSGSPCRRQCYACR